MKFLVLSDLHLTQKFNKKKYLLLKELFNQYENIVINGDFYDGYLTTFDKFVKSQWSKLFPLLKSKNVIYIYGNHDVPEYVDNRVLLFSSGQQKSCKLKVGNNSYYIDHGHDKVPISTDNPKIRYVKMFLTEKIYDFFVNFMVNIFKEDYFIIAKLGNKFIKKWQKRNVNKDEIYISAHSHFQEADSANNYYNSGVFNYHLAQFLVIDDEGVKLYRKRY